MINRSTNLLNIDLGIMVIKTGKKAILSTKKKKKDDLVYINDKKIHLETICFDSTILKLCDLLEITIPRFCYHDKLAIAGNCRMCMVEIKSSPKPVIACSTKLVRWMHIYTSSFFVKKARENVMEFLLINHPLDCPICDQGGECDLQDQAFSFGSDRGRFKEIKRSVQDIFMGPVVKTIMTRCIHCTRCIRFSEDVIGNYGLGRLGRGELTEIGTYLKKPFLDELSGNIVDLCPVGALTSKSYAFKARPWELKNLESIDIFDSLGSNIRVDVKGNEIMRILPKPNYFLNREWITDKIRFSYQGFKSNRIIYPMYRNNKNELLRVCSNSFLLNSLIKRLTNYYNNNKANWQSRIRVELSNYFTSGQDYFLIYNFFSFLGITNINYSSKLVEKEKNIDFRYNYLFNYFIQIFETHKNYLLDNIDLKSENPIINSRLKNRKLLKGTNINISYIGKNINLNYDFNHISNTHYTFFTILEGKHFYSTKLSKNATILNNGDNNYSNINLYKYLKQYIYTCNKKKTKTVHISTILNNSSNVTMADLGHINNSSNKLSFNTDICYLYNMEYNKNNIQLEIYKNSKELIYHGTNITEEIKKYTTFLIPSTSFFENSLSFSNCLGYGQTTNKVLTPLNNYFSTFDLIENLSNNKDIPSLSIASFYTLKLLNYKFNKLYPYLISDRGIISKKYNNLLNKNQILNIVQSNTNSNYNNITNINYYKTDNVTLNSEILQKCSLLYINNQNNFFKNTTLFEYIL